MKKIRRPLLLVLVLFIVFCIYEIQLGYDKYTKALNVKPLETAVSELKSKENYNNGRNCEAISSHCFNLAKREICSAPGYTIGTRHL